MSTAADNEKKKNSLRTITLEEHFVTTAFMAGPGREMRQMLEAFARSTQRVTASELIDRLLDLGEHRISALDAAGIDMQVLSLTRGVDSVEEEAEAVKLARDSNDLLADAAKRYPARFAGFAALPVLVPDKVADELERTVKEHSFKGTMIHGHSRGRYLDDKFFWPILARAEELNVPIHPTPPPEPVIKTNYVGNYILTRGDGPALGCWVGLAHRNRAPRFAHNTKRSIRHVSQAPAVDRPYGGGSSVHDAQN